MNSRQSLIGLCFVVFSVAACVSPAGDTAGPTEEKMTTDKTKTSPAIQESEAVAKRRELREQLARSSGKQIEVKQRVQDGEAGRILGEVPDEMLEKIITDLVSKIGATRADIEVIHAESVTWNDGSLGCGKPGEMYTQALVPGYHVILGHEGQQFDYRATVKGYFMLCEQPTLAVPGAGGKPPVQ